MSTVTVPTTCLCNSLSPTAVRCSDHHRYFREGKELTSVSKILRRMIPPDFSKVDPAVLENARDRGATTDELFCSYIEGTLRIIRGGTRADAVELFQKLRHFWDKGTRVGRTQVILADDEVAGTCDIIESPDMIWDIKCSYDIDPSYSLQLGAYADLFERKFGTLPMIGILHATKRYDEVRTIPLNAEQCRDDWRKLRDAYYVIQRRSGKD